MTLRPARRRRYALSQYATVRGFSLWQQEWFGFFFPRRRRRPTNGELSRPGQTAEQVAEAKFFRKPRASEKPLTPPGRLQRFVSRIIG